MCSAIAAWRLDSKTLVQNVPYNRLCTKWRPIRRCLVNRLQKGCWFGRCLVYGTCAWPELVLVFLFYLSSILCPKDFFGVASSDSLRWIRSCLTGFLCSLPISFPSGRRKTSSMGNEQITLLVQLLPGWSSWQDQALFKHLPTEFEKCGFQSGEARPSTIWSA